MLGDMQPSPYILQNNDLLLSGGEKPYVLRIRDLPEREKPREKLALRGPGSLSVAELLAVVLGTGTTKEDVLSMSSRVIREYGERALLSRTDAAELAEELQVPATKAAQIVAVGELGRRFYKRGGITPIVIRTGHDVYEYTQGMRTLAKEHLRGLYLNTHYQVIHDEVISIGTVDANLVHPREVFRPALEHAAAAVILVHNHPSGISTPSEADKAVTRQLIEAGKLIGIDLIDHVIVTAEGYESVLG